MVEKMREIVKVIFLCVHSAFFKGTGTAFCKQDYVAKTFLLTLVETAGTFNMLQACMQGNFL